jgi:hypothetical protein
MQAENIEPIFLADFVTNGGEFEEVSPKSSLADFLLLKLLGKFKKACARKRAESFAGYPGHSVERAKTSVSFLDF